MQEGFRDLIPTKLIIILTGHITIVQSVINLYQIYFTIVGTIINPFSIQQYTINPFKLTNIYSIH